MQVVAKPIEEPAVLVHRETGLLLVLQDKETPEVLVIALEDLLHKV